MQVFGTRLAILSLSRNRTIIPIRPSLQLFRAISRTKITNESCEHKPGQASIRTMASSAPAAASELEKLQLNGDVQFPNSYPQYNPIDFYKAHVATLLAKVAGVDPKIVYPAVQWTQVLDNGDLVVATAALRIKGAKPQDLAVKWAEEFPESDLLEKPTAADQYLQFRFKAAPLISKILPQVFKNKTAYGENPLLGLKDPKEPEKGKKRILIEFSSPNIAKPFHAGHLRSTIIGGFLSHLYSAAGYEVIKLNYLGDWGKQYGLLALAYTRYGDAALLEANPIAHLFDLYVKINGELSKEKEEAKALDDEVTALPKLQEEIKAAEAAGQDTTELKGRAAPLEQLAQKAQHIKDEGLDEQARRYFKKMCDGDEAALDLWRKFRDLSITRYKQTYARLNIQYDHYLGESLVKPESMDMVEEEMDKAGLTEISQGAKLINFETILPGKPGKQLGKALIKKKDGTSLYLTRDLGAIRERETTWHFDEMIYVVASEQTVHLKQLFKTTELCGRKELAAKCSHITFGLVLGMSTRKGTVKFLDDILRDVGDYMHEVMRKNEAKYAQIEDPAAVADILGISSVMVQDMSGKRINNYHFSMDAMTSFEGDTGPYLQYAHARLCSIFRKAGITTQEIEAADLSLLTEPHAVNIVRLVARWPDTVVTALKTQEPTTVLTYLFRLTHVVSSSYDVLKVLGSEPELLKARLALYEATRVTLGNGMRLLGLTPVERM